MDKNYWNNFYKNNQITNQRSDFANFCAEQYKDNHGILIDVGCGNARDTFFFSSKGISCIGIDQSKKITENNQKKIKYHQTKNISFLNSNFTNIKFDKIVNHPYSIYSRFTLHAINYEEEQKFISNCKSQSFLKYLFIEARSINDDLYGKGKIVGNHEFITTHYRRFIDPQEIKKKLSENFKIIFFNESKGYSKKSDEDDPCLIRIIAKKN